MDRRRYWRIIVWGSGFGADGGLYRTQEEAYDEVNYLIQCMGLEPEMVSVITTAEKDELAKMNRPSEWFTGPRGGTFRLSGTGRLRIYI